MDALPRHGRINCTKCFSNSVVEFNVSTIGTTEWRITANPLAWGNAEPEIIVLGFSKGPTQQGSLALTPHNKIAYKGSRANVGKILSHIGVLSIRDTEGPAAALDRVIEGQSAKFHFGSLIRCTVERFDNKNGNWRGSGGGMLDKFIATPFGQSVASNCTKRFLSTLPCKTKLVVMFGLGTKLNYVRAAYNLYKTSRPGSWRWINDIAYTDGKIVVVHVEHFSAQGALIPNWLGEKEHVRAQYGLMAQEAVAKSCLVD